MRNANPIGELLRVDAVEWRSLQEMGEFVRGKRFVKTDITSSGTPCIHYGELYTHFGISAKEAKSFLDAEFASKLRYARPGDVIIVAAGETIEDIGNGVAWLGKDDIVIHDACFAYRSKLNPAYVSYFLRTKAFKEQIKRQVSSGKISSINSSGLGKASIPIPYPQNLEKSLEIQAEIVRILDKFTELTAALAAELVGELAARRKQYNHYRNQLLRFEDGEVEWKSLRDVAEVRSGWGFPIAEQGRKEGEYPFYKVSDMNTAGNETTMTKANSYIDGAAAKRLGVKVAPPGTVIFPKIGAAVATNKKRLLSVASAYDNNVMGLIPGKAIGSRFLFYWMQTINLSKLANDSGAVPSIRKSEMEEMLVPVPRHEEQSRIVAIIEKLDALFQSIAESLPREIDLRQKQYDYYRDLLLSFPKPEDAKN